MLTEQRKQLILDRLKRDGRVVAKDLSAELALSEDTIRRDLRELAAAGLLTRVHGGALPASPTVAGLPARRVMAVEEKQKLAAAGAALVERGQTVFIDGGTTNLALVRHLPLSVEATVITHSPQIAAALEPHEGVKVILVGGTLLRHSMVCVGAAALEAVTRLRADLFFLGLTGLHAEEGGTTGDYEEAQIKRAILQRSAEVVSLLSAEKIGAVSRFLVCRADALSSVIVPRRVPHAALAATGIRILEV